MFPRRGPVTGSRPFAVQGTDDNRWDLWYNEARFCSKGVEPMKQWDKAAVYRLLTERGI